MQVTVPHVIGSSSTPNSSHVSHPNREMEDGGEASQFSHPKRSRLSIHEVGETSTSIIENQ